MLSTKNARARRSPRQSSRRGAPTPKLSHLRPPGRFGSAGQKQLRRQFGRSQAFEWEYVGAEPVFSEFTVVNPQSGNRYRVAIRGVHPGENFCACPDFATNDLGTCKHIEFVLGRRHAWPAQAPLRLRIGVTGHRRAPPDWQGASLLDRSHRDSHRQTIGIACWN